MALQRAASDRLAVLAGDEHGGIGLGHLLGGHVEHELRRRQLEQRGVQLGDQRANVILQGAFYGDRNRHHAPCGTNTCRTVATSCRRSKPALTSSKPMRWLIMRSTGSLPCW